jgi:hypothetical protein
VVTQYLAQARHEIKSLIYRVLGLINFGQRHLMITTTLVQSPEHRAGLLSELVTRIRNALNDYLLSRWTFA